MGDLIAGRYKIVTHVAAGGMGIVYKVADSALNDEEVALKILNPHLAQDAVVFQRFLNEVKVARSLSHPNIVRIHDIGKSENGFSYITMEFVDGESVRDKLDKIKEECALGHRPTPGLEFSEAMELFLQVLRGVSCAHEQNIIHRDLKPANILLTREGRAKVADFGTARIVGANTGLTQDGKSLGTPDYMAPEQIAGQELDNACDIYALGIIGYELVVGEKPFIGENVVSVAYKQVNEPTPHFASFEQGIPDWYERLIHIATAKKKNERFKNVKDFEEAILAGLRGEQLPHDLAGFSTLTSSTSIHGRDDLGGSGVRQALVPTGMERESMHSSRSSGSAMRSLHSAGMKGKLSHERKKNVGLQNVIVASLVIAGAALGFFILSGVEEVKQNPASEESSRAEVRKSYEEELSLLFPKEEPAKKEEVQEGEKIEEPEVAPVAQKQEPESRPEVKQEVELVKKEEPTVVKEEPKVVAKVIEPKVKEKPPVVVSGGESYAGFLQSKTVSSPKQTLTLNLKFNGDSISGSANLQGSGTMSVSGRSAERGLELNLSGGGRQLRLTGYKRDKVLRGTYTEPAKNEAGQWQVSAH